MNNFISKPFSIALFLCLCFVSMSFRSFAQCGAILSPLTITGTPPPFTGAMTLATNVTISGAGTVVTFDNLQLGANATTRSITVTGGATLIIQNNSVLTTCTITPTWVGIIVNANSNVQMTTNSTISNAVTGIRANASSNVQMMNSTIQNTTTGINVVNAGTPANINITNSQFNANTTSINMNTYSGGHPANIIGNFFTGTTGSPTVGIKVTGPSAGLSMSLLPIAGNSFSSLTTGIQLTNCINTIIPSCRFTAVDNGVSATNTAGSSSPCSIDVMSGVFLTCRLFGITLNGKISHNSILNSFNFMPAGSVCLKSNNARANGIMVINNTFGNYDAGVLIQNFINSNVDITSCGFADNPSGLPNISAVSVSCTGNSGSTVNVTNNQFLNNIRDGKTAINMTNTLGINAGNIAISYNSMLNYENGILCSTLGTASTIQQSNNTINWSIPSSAVAHFGIKNIACRNINTTENWVTMNNVSTNFFTSYYYENCDFVSVNCNRSYNPTTFTAGRTGFDFKRTVATSFTTANVENNEDVRAQFGFRFTSSVGNTPVRFMGNRMDSETSAGLRLAGWGIGGLAMQGAPGIPSWNRWWGSIITKTPAGLTNLPTFYHFGLLPPEFLAPVPAAACPFIVTTGAAFSSPCLPPIVFKASAINPIDLSEFAEQDLVYSAVENIPTSDIKTTTDLTDKFYPNPVTNTAYYEVEMPEASEGNIQLLDIQGRLLLQKDLQHGYNKVEFDLTEMPNGMYIYKVISDKTILKTGKFVVQK